MVWFFKKRTLKKPVVLVGAACTSVLVGVMFYSNRFPHHYKQQHQSPSSLALPSKQCIPCNNASSYSSYARLQKFETTKHFRDSVVKRLDVVFLGSNSPIEDRFVVGTSANLGAGFFSVIDGHKGTHCSQYLQDNMLQHISSRLHKSTNFEEDLRIVLDMNVVKSKKDPDAPITQGGIAKSVIEAEKLEEDVRLSLVDLDETMSQRALDQVIVPGRKKTPETILTILAAFEGAVALTAVVREKDVIVASTGDCRVVMGRRGKETGQWETIPLSIDQNANNPDEVKRLKAAHPGEESTVIMMGRVLGGLQPFRSFGDVDYKWDKQHVSLLTGPWDMPEYQTPPYVTAEPVMTQHSRDEGDKFLILATDGFWDQVSSEDAVKIVSSVLGRPRASRNSKLEIKNSQKDSEPHDQVSGSHDQPCCDTNVATELLWHALGGNHDAVSKMLDVPQESSRAYRDDITVMVVHL